VLVLDSDKRQAEQVCDLVRARGYQARALASWDEVGPPGPGPEVLLVDLDTVRTDDRQLRDLCRGGKRRLLMTMSAVPHHPHLSESMQRFVFAALIKPLDPDEIGFWLKSVERMKEPAWAGNHNHE
jgi:DNA-binding NtrC family response regulator